MKKVLGGIMLGAGILIAGLSGLCTLAVVVAGLSDMGSNPLDFLLSGLIMVMIVGGIPFALGLGLFFGGRGLVRQAQREEEGPRD